mmetsp:Transcript_37720/g.84031  ORF Transcript_37720/g.84031 Transcript_37720/m.84031 type:complete len:466 (-) Transcript_37720:347-1744(-)
MCCFAITCCSYHTMAHRDTHNALPPPFKSCPLVSQVQLCSLLPCLRLACCGGLLVHAVLKRLLERLAVQLLANEHHAAAPLLIGPPLAVCGALKHGVHALVHKAVLRAGNGEDTLHAVDVLRACLKQEAERVVDLVQVHILVDDNADGGDLVVVLEGCYCLVLVALVAAVSAAALVLMLMLMCMAVIMVVVVLVAVMGAVRPAAIMVVVMAVAVGMPMPMLGLVVMLVALVTAVGTTALVVVVVMVVVAVAVGGQAHLQLLLDCFQVKAAHSQHIVNRHAALDTALHTGQLVDLLDALLQGLQLGGADQVGLVEQDPVSVRDLLHRLVDHALALVLIQVLSHVLGVNHRHHTVQADPVRQVRVHEEGGDDGGGIGQSGRLNQDVVKLLAALPQLVECVDEVPAHTAAQAAVGELHDGVIGPLQQLLLGHQLTVNVNLTKLVLNHRDALAMLLSQDVVQQRGLAGT